MSDEKPLALKDIFRLSKQVGHVPFSEVVRESSGFEVIAIDEQTEEDKELLRHLGFALNNFMKLAEKSGMRFKAGRINDVGKKFENVVTEEVKKTPIHIKRLGSSGYPDFEITQDPNDRLTYLEIKSTGVLQSDSSTFRTFYYTGGKKLRGDARHLLVKFQMEEEENKSWRVMSWELRDLAKLEIQLKAEFFTGFAGLHKTPLLDSSTLKRDKKGQGKLQ